MADKLSSKSRGTVQKEGNYSASLWQIISSPLQPFGLVPEERGVLVIWFGTLL